MKFLPEFKEILDQVVKEAIERIPQVSMGFKGTGLDLKKYVIMKWIIILV